MSFDRDFVRRFKSDDPQFTREEITKLRNVLHARLSENWPVRKNPGWSHELAEDTVTETIKTAYTIVRRLKDDGFLPWIFTILELAARNEYKKEKRHLERLDPSFRRYDSQELDPIRKLPDGSPGPEARAMSAAGLREIEDAVKKLTDIQQNVFRCRIEEGLSSRETAIRLETTVNAVDSALADAKKKLKRLLEEQV